ncbi:hypothetical protein AUT26_08435 [[Arthrobacter] sp. ATCC 21022]|nr:hypothetical protein AUT26_08435 [Arthrobacter sp. ATCC 21022]
MAFDQGRDRRLVVRAGDGVDEPGRALFAYRVGFATRSAGTECCLDLAFESASGLDVEGLIDRLRAHRHLRVVWELFDQLVADLFRRPAQEQFVLHIVTQVRLDGELAVLGPARRAAAFRCAPRGR